MDRFGGKRRKRVFRVFGQNGQNTPREQSKKGVFAFSPFLLILVILGFPDLGCFADGTDLGSFWVDLGSISGSRGRSQDLGGDLRIWHLDLRSEILDLRSDLRISGSISGSGGQIGPSQDLRGRFGPSQDLRGVDLGSFGVIWGGSPERGRFGVIWGVPKGGRFWTPFPEGPQMAPFGQWPDSQFWLRRSKGTLLVSGRFGFLGVRNLVIWGKKRPRNVGLFEMTCSKKSEFKTLRS